MFLSSRACHTIAFIAAVFGASSGLYCDGFFVPTFVKRIERSFHSGEIIRSDYTALFVSLVKDTPQSPENFEDDDKDNDDDAMLKDESLLKKTRKAQLEEICNQLGLSTKGTKMALLQRLRKYANEQSDLERRRQLDRRTRVEEGGTHEKERYEIVGGEDDLDDEEDGFFYYYTPEEPSLVDEQDKSEKSKPSVASKEENTNKKEKSRTSTHSVLTAPPPPQIEPNENGERVVTVYSTTEQNDLTGVAAAQPGQAAVNDPMVSEVGSSGDEPWDMEKTQKGKASSQEVDAAREGVADLVQSLLAMTGAPAFLENADDLSFLGIVQKQSSYSPPDVFTGFDPAKVPAEMLSTASKALRIGRGQVLQEILHEFELRAIGHDGLAGDDVEKGGGHYHEMSKVRAFLEGYRKAEVRRVARETTTLLLEKLLLEGIEGLDVTLASMARSSDDTSTIELNDSLLDYLNDAIRQQEKKVEQIVGEAPKNDESLHAAEPAEDDDETEQLWVVDSEDGQRVETLDPNDPKVKEVLKEEHEKFKKEEAVIPRPQIPTTAPEKLLLLLSLLRERLKTEAAFAYDEKSRNLRVLAYCLHLPTDEAREQLIMKEFGSSFDRLESFMELVSSSIEYGESTSHQLQPTKARPLNVAALKNILELTEEVRARQAWKASGGNSNPLRP